MVLSHLFQWRLTSQYRKIPPNPGFPIHPSQPGQILAPQVTGLDTFSRQL